MERSVEVATGESVAFSYELAGLGSRFVAVGIDLAIQVAVLAIGAVVLAFVARVAGPSHAAPLGKFGDAALLALGYFALFVLFFGYFIVFEIAWEGRTPGKRLLGIRVVRDGGFALDVTSAVVRNVVRILELGLGFYALSAVATLLSPMNRRFGDMAAGTLVVRDERYDRTTARTLADVRRANVDDDPVIAALSPTERDLVRRYVLRRPSLGLAARANVAARIAATVRPKLTASFAHLDDDDLLVHLANTALGA